MIRFHNRVVDTQLGGVPAAQKFDKAREIVTKHYQWMIRTDYLPRIAKAGRGQQRLQPGPQGVRGGRRRRPTCRRCRSSSRSPGSGSGTRWCAPPTTGTRSSTTAAARSTCCSSSRRPAATSAATPARQHLDRGLPAPLRLQRGEQAGPHGAGEQVQPRDADRHADRRPAPAPAAADGRPAGQHGLQRRAAEPRLPQPHAREDGEARHRPADGQLPEEQGREPSRS